MISSGDNNGVSPGSIGAKIKKIREYRGLTQKQLGMRCGFSETTAAVRIGQYERNKKTLREKALNILCDALEIGKSALFNADLLITDVAKHVLFEFEDFYGLRPVKLKDKYYLEFCESTALNQKFYACRKTEFLKCWFEKLEECAPSGNDSEDVKNIKKMQYDLWRYEYCLDDE